jgi:putative membrane protein
MGWSCDMPGWGGHWFGGLLMLLFWVLIIVGIAALVRGFLPRSGGVSPAAPESPLEILKRRYAKGEVDKAEFEEKKRDILG